MIRALVRAIRAAWDAAGEVAPQESDTVIRCPECRSEDFVAHITTQGQLLRGGRVLPYYRGALIECAQCGHKFGSSPTGTYKPAGVRLSELQQAQRQQAAPPNDAPPPGDRMPPLPRPKERPRV